MKLNFFLWIREKHIVVFFNTNVLFYRIQIWFIYSTTCSISTLSRHQFFGDRNTGMSYIMDSDLMPFLWPLAEQTSQTFFSKLSVPLMAQKSKWIIIIGKVLILNFAYAEIIFILFHLWCLCPISEAAFLHNFRLWVKNTRLIDFTNARLMISTWLHPMLSFYNIFSVKPNSVNNMHFKLLPWFSEIIKLSDPYNPVKRNAHIVLCAALLIPSVI